MNVYKINVETGLLACDEAVAKVLTEIDVLSLSGEPCALKVIHGYGSKGVGGKIKQELFKTLKTLKNTNKIKDFINNEKFTQNSPVYKAFAPLYPQLILDEDLKNLNPGITIIFLN